MNQDHENTVTPVFVTVTVDDGGDTVVVCKPDPVPVTAPNSLIAFHLHTPGYHFKLDDAVVLSVPTDDFPYPSWTVTPELAALFDLCNDVDTFSYTVNVVRTATGEEFSVDPEIRNGDGEDN